MYNRLSKFFNSFKLLTDKQFGFRENHSTAMALINLIDKISESLENRNFTIGIFIDLSKAFDTIDHSILLDKLYLYGIRGVVHNWFTRYLSNRSQFVTVVCWKLFLNIK